MSYTTNQLQMATPRPRAKPPKNPVQPVLAGSATLPRRVFTHPPLAKHVIYADPALHVPDITTGEGIDG
jgi:hypothetical protein